MQGRTMLRLILVMSIALMVGCKSQPNDAQITKDIETKAAADVDTKEATVAVTSNEGKVKLTGKVPSDTASKKLKQIAKEEPGVSDVDDETSIDPTLAAAAAPAAAMTPAPPPPPPPQPIVVPAGTVLTVKTGESLSSKSSQAGQTFTATLAQPISVDGKPALPTGAAASGTVVSAQAKGKIKGEGELSVTLTSISVGGHTYQIKTSTWSNTEKGKGKRTAATTGGGAAAGALIGGLAGGGKGAGIGALVGGGAGLVGGAATGNKQVEIPAESALSFRLSAPLTLPPPGQ